MKDIVEPAAQPVAVDAAHAASMATYKNYLLTVLLAVLAFNYVDRLALGIVLQDIKVDLQLSDTQLGLLSGLAFAVFYSVMGIPIARWADRGNRVIIISVTAALWSAAVALCGAAGTFVQLLLARIAVAVGESGCIPPAHSLIADYFTRAERPRAVARYMLGVPISGVIGYLLAGWLSEFYGWRAMFVILSAPGLALAALAWTTLKEPRCQPGISQAGEPRDAALTEPATGMLPAAHPGLKQVFASLWVSATFRHLLAGYSLLSFFHIGITKWQPTFFIRSYGLHTGELGTWFAVIYGLGGMLGMYLGGELASRYAANNECRQLKAMGIVYCCFAVVTALAYMSPHPLGAVALLGFAAIGSAATIGPFFAALQTLVPPGRRATSIAIVYLFANLIGMGLGPLVAGALSDGLRPWLGEESLRYALLILSPGYVLVAWHVWQASRTVRSDLASN